MQCHLFLPELEVMFTTFEFGSRFSPTQKSHQQTRQEKWVFMHLTQWLVQGGPSPVWNGVTTLKMAWKIGNWGYTVITPINIRVAMIW